MTIEQLLNAFIIVELTKHIVSFTQFKYTVSTFNVLYPQKTEGQPIAPL